MERAVQKKHWIGRWGAQVPALPLSMFITMNSNKNSKPLVLNRRRQWHPTPVLLPGKSMDKGDWWAAVHRVAKSRERLGDFTFTFHLHALEKEKATHSSVLAWRTPGMGKPGGLPSLGLHRVRHD